MYTGIIYCFISPSGKYYIGQTKRTLKSRVAEHISCAKCGKHTAFHRAIKKYGIQNFKLEKLCEIKATRIEELPPLLDIAERYYISYYKKLGNQLYNLTEGGDFVYDHTGEKLSTEHKNKIREHSLQWHEHLTTAEKTAWCEAVSKGRKKPIIQLTLDGMFIAEWPSQKEVPFMKQSTLGMCLTGKNKTAGGYKWMYKKDYEHLSSNQTDENIL